MKAFFLRHPKTTQEARSVLDAEDEGVKIRPKRNRANLPNAYDDIVIGEAGKQNLCWKKKRKTKYKA